MKSASNAAPVGMPAQCKKNSAIFPCSVTYGSLSKAGEKVDVRIVPGQTGMSGIALATPLDDSGLDSDAIRNTVDVHALLRRHVPHAVSLFEHDLTARNDRDFSAGYSGMLERLLDELGQRIDGRGHRSVAIRGEIDDDLPVVSVVHAVNPSVSNLTRDTVTAQTRSLLAPLMPFISLPSIDNLLADPQAPSPRRRSYALRSRWDQRAKAQADNQPPLRAWALQGVRTRSLASRCC